MKALYECPSLAKKIILGTDFPIAMKPRIEGQLESLIKVGLADNYIEQIASNRLPKRQF